MRKVKITSNGATLVARVYGETQHFLLLHAGGENKDVWLPIQERLARAGLGSAAFDQRGHGESSGSRKERIECFAADLKQMNNACRGTRVLVGASLGGLASVIALQDQKVQSSLSGLVMVDVVPAPDPDRVRAFLGTTAPQLAESFLVGDILDKSALLSQASSRIEIPILLVRAGQAGPLTDDDVTNFREHCPQLTVEHVDTTGHLIAQNAPTALADILLHFEQSAAVQNRSA
ncbi:alpha/beta fold hydrolase [uncultured Ruegeria sp.]|uniref:alpha/beta hydrolase n=1 Tax=uncultured Ruegeria sp. TaxID=259304 RepID=UPI00262401BC|nr:alpha/beta fold hydrolase [uncultured Ruegeria sp.]